MTAAEKTAGKPPVHCAVTLIVREGKEAEFEDMLVRFIQRSLDYRGTTGVHMIRPVPGSGSREYGILRSFLSEEHSREFYDSEMFRQYRTESAELVEGDPVIRPLHGFEAFFGGHSVAPARWKMATVTWLGVFPSVWIWATVLPPLLTALHPILVSAIVDAFVVITLAWCFMPLLTRVCAGWLHSKTIT